MFILLLLGLGGLILTGSVCGIVAMFRLRRHESTLTLLHDENAHLRADLKLIFRLINGETPSLHLPSTVGTCDMQSADTEPPPVSGPEQSIAPEPVLQEPDALQRGTADSTSPSHTTTPPVSFEFLLGTRWIIWLGALIFLGGVALALKYSYDNNLIGPTGRLMIGAATGIAALCVGEYYWNRRLVIPFQAFTGAGLATFYLCIFFSFQIYNIFGAGMAMSLAVCITGLAIFLAVVHNALPIALLAVAGGYMSPIFLSSGQNAPWTLFTYIALLNLVALGAAFFRRWRILDLFCLLCTGVLYQLWHVNYYSYPDQMAPALTFITLFYLMFMITPMMYGLVRGIPEDLRSVTLLLSNTLLWLFSYYNVLFENHRHNLGFIVLAQAILTFGLYRLWIRQVKEETRVAKSLLAITLSLLILVVPLQLRFHTVAVTWAIQGVLLLWLSYRFKNILCRIGGVTALALAVVALEVQLPLHTRPFTPVFNGPFGAWLFVSLCLTGAAIVARRCTLKESKSPPLLVMGFSIAALALLCQMVTMETFLYWRLDGRDNWFANMSDSMILLWTLVPVLLTAGAWRMRKAELVLLAQAVYIVALIMFLYSLTGLNNRDERLLINLYFVPRLVFIIALWKSISLFGQVPWKENDLHPLLFRQRPVRINWALELAGHGALALLCFAELIRWGQGSPLISRDMAVGVISAVWALHACALIWHGLASRQRFRRYAGFLLFALATCKTILVDTFNLEAAHRIVSWLGIGMLLVVAALLYQRYSTLFLAENETEEGNGRKKRL